MMGKLFDSRSYEPEMLDDLSVSGNDLNRNLWELEVINKYLGGNSVIKEGILKLNPENHQLKIVDLGCGGGDLPLYIHNFLSKKGINSSILGIDANPAVIDYARERTQTIPSIHYSVDDILNPGWVPPEADIFTLSLFCHHFPEDQIKTILKKCLSQAKKGIIINDLHRHPLAYYSIKFLTSAFSKSRMVKNDAALSVLRGFRKNELEKILHGAGINTYHLLWRWPFRFLGIISVPSSFQN